VVDQSKWQEDAHHREIDGNDHARNRRCSRAALGILQCGGFVQKEGRMKRELEIGTLMSGAKFTLPVDLVTRTLAVIAIRGWGKTVAATVIAEEMCECGLPWVALDPVGVWWGLRATADGRPSDYPVVVIGGQHADIPVQKDAGPKIAEAILQENVSCVIDLAGESKNTWRYFATEFCEHLMSRNAAVSHHVFVEEAPEFVPQRPMGEQKRSLAAIDRLVRLGRNFGYGATLISQRFATVNKDVLTQCENLIAGASVGKTDRDACADWIAEVVHDTESAKKAETFMQSLSGLPGGRGWFWSPRWLDIFKQVQIRQRKTFHPGATRSVGQNVMQVQMADVRQFVERFNKVFFSAPKQKTRETGLTVNFTPTPEPVRAFRDEAAALREENSKLRADLGKANQIIGNLRKQLEPEYRAYQALFGDLDSASNASANGHSAAWDVWKQKLGGGMAKMIDALIAHGELTRIQLATVCAMSPNSGTYASYLARLNSNGVIEKDGNKIRLRQL
jgi:hypothetical protein